MILEKPEGVLDREPKKTQISPIESTPESESTSDVQTFGIFSPPDETGFADGAFIVDEPECPCSQGEWAHKARMLFITGDVWGKVTKPLSKAETEIVRVPKSLLIKL